MKKLPICLSLLFFCVLSCTPFPREKVWIYFPADGSGSALRSTIEGRAYDKDGVDILELIVSDLSSGSAEILPLQRLASVHDGVVLEQLSKFRKTVVFPGEGTYSLSVRMLDKGGDVLLSQPIKLNVRADKKDLAFTMFSVAHLIPLLLLVLMNAAMVVAAKKSPRLKRLIPWLITVVLWGDEVFLHLTDFILGAWTVTNNLMLHMCGISVLLCPVMLLHPKQQFRQKLFPYMFFWGFGGAMQALLTPDIGVFGFPSHRYFTIFISHGFIITSVVYMTLIEHYRVTLRDTVRVYLVTAAAMLPMYAIDHLIKLLPPYEAGSYFFLLYPPVDGSAIDILVSIFGPSPWYLIGLAILAAAVFFLLTLPFVIAEKIAKKRSKA